VKTIDPTQEPLAIETEILQERVATLARVARTLNAHLEDLYRAHDELLCAPPDEHPQQVQRFRELEELVRTWYWYLIVQREANGLRHHDGIAQHYPIPSVGDSR
jgi:hypothetical protein